VAKQRTRLAAALVLAPVVLAMACGARTELTSEGSASPSRDADPRVDAEGGLVDVSPDAPPDRMPVDSSERDVPLDTCPVETSCPPGYAVESCEVCIPSSFVISDTALYGLSLPGGTVHLIGPTGGHSLTDVAIDPSGHLFGVSDLFLYSVEPMTGTPTMIAPVAEYPNALGFGSDGTLYAASAYSIFTIDPATGAETPFAPFPVDYMSSGDLAVIGRTLYASAAGGSEDELATLDLDSLAGNVVGPIGFGCVWGLAAYAGTLFGFTCMGEIVQIDVTNGKGTLVSSPGEAFAGAATR
jgi:hypothetical protein